MPGPMETMDPTSGLTTPVGTANPLPMAGAVAEGGTAGNRPLLIGGKAASSLPADTPDGKVVAPLYDPKGRLHTINDGALSPSVDGLALGGDAASAGSLDTLLTDALVATKVEIKALPGRLHYVYVHNPNAFVVWLHFYNLAAANVTVGSSTRKLTFGIAASWNGPLLLPAVPIGFDTGITHAATKTNATGSTAPDVGLTVVVGYK